MEAIIFIGLQASGKSTFFAQSFYDSHVRINLDMLRTRRRERRLIEVCLEIGQPFVIDNTNPSRADRKRYFGLLAGTGVKVVGYCFRSEPEACRRRNASRPSSKRVPEKAIPGTLKRLEPPTLDEGFAELRFVRATDDGGFELEARAP